MLDTDSHYRVPKAILQIVVVLLTSLMSVASGYYKATVDYSNKTSEKISNLNAQVAAMQMQMNGLEREREELRMELLAKLDQLDNRVASLTSNGNGNGRRPMFEEEKKYR